MEHFADRVFGQVEARGTPAVVGLDPRPDLIPAVLRQKYRLDSAAGRDQWAAAIEEFCMEVLEVAARAVALVKFQSAFFELHGSAGIGVLERCLSQAEQLGLIRILDGKRGDIGSTSEAYAQAAFRVAEQVYGQCAEGPGADAITVHPYLGQDSLEPFLRFVSKGERGLFVLVRTSNPGARDLEELRVAETGRPVFATVARWVAQWSRDSRGRCGYGAVGAVVGGTAGRQIAELREEMPEAILLVPGYGAQGATAEDIAPAFDANGRGAIVNSSRAVLFPYVSGGKPSPDPSADWEGRIRDALDQMIGDLRGLCRPRSVE